jgi:hypothetical protein
LVFAKDTELDEDSTSDDDNDDDDDEDDNDDLKFKTEEYVVTLLPDRGPNVGIQKREEKKKRVKGIKMIQNEEEPNLTDQSK